MTRTVPSAASLAPIFRTRAEVEAANLPAIVWNISVDGLGYRRTALGNALQSGDGDWWEPSDNIVYPEHFNANVNGAECGAELTTYWSYLRSSGKQGQGNAGVYDHGTTTMYIGGVRFNGSGAPQNLGATGFSRTVFESNANPGVMGVASAATSTTFHQCNFTNTGFRGAGGTVAPIDLPTYPGFTKQVGGIFGRNTAFLQTISGGETAGTGGAGGSVFYNVVFEDFDWGIVGYKWWGKSANDQLFFRRCGGKGAYELGDDLACGGIWILSGSVDLRFNNIHMYNGGYANSLHSQRGTGIRIGDSKAAHTAEDVLFDPSTYIVLSGIHTEGYAYPLNLYAGKAVFIENCNFKGPTAGTGILRVGCGTTGDADVRVMFGRNKLFDIERIQVTHGGVDLGQIYNQEASAPVIIDYWSTVKFSGLGGDVSTTGVPTHKLTFNPRGIPSDMADGFGSRSTNYILPYAATDYEPTDPTQNELSKMAATDGGALVGWVQTTGTVQATKTWSLRVKDSGTGSDPGAATLAHSGLVVDQLYTFCFWVDMLATNHFLSDIEFGIDDGTDDIIPMKTLGEAVAGFGTVEYRIFNFRATTTSANIKFVNNDLNNVQFNCPILVPGTMRHLGRHRWPNVWCTRDAGWVACV